MIVGERMKKMIASENALRDPRFHCRIDTVNDMIDGDRFDIAGDVIPSL